jgi:hypothetical protein
MSRFVCEVESKLIFELDAKVEDDVEHKEFPNVSNTFYLIS